jgi:hypothetical protein
MDEAERLLFKSIESEYDSSILIESSSNNSMLNDSIISFLEDFGDLILESPIRDVYLSYVSYCRETGIKPVSKIAFGRELSSLGFKSKTKSYRGEHIRFYIKNNH